MTDPLGTLLLGRMLAERYTVEEVLGRGGMSVVYRATDQKLGRPVALKVVAPGAGPEHDRAHMRDRFRREAAAAAAIPPHPNVVQIYDYGTDPELDLDFLVMELLIGRDLKEAYAQAPPAPAEALHILVQAAQGLAAGHRAGIVHRDVKPANLFLSWRGDEETLRVLDFGIAKALEPGDQGDLTRTGQHVYSPAYASPEQLRGERHITAASDVYQLGLIGYELLAGERPFTPEDRERIRAGERVPLPARGRWAGVAPGICRVVERALRPEPAERFANAGEMGEALSHVSLAADPMPPVAGPATSAATLAAPAAPAWTEPDPALHGVPVAVAGAGGGGGKASGRSRSLLDSLPDGWRRALPLALIGLFVLFLIVRGLSDDSEAAPVAATGAAAAVRDGGDAAGDSGVPEEVGTELRQAVTDLNQSWVEGDLRRHVRHYASRVDYYNSRRLARSGILRDRRRDLNRYPERRIDVHNVRLERLEEDRIRALVDKSWRFYGPQRGERSGSGLQEYVFKRDEDDGEWYVVSEQLLEQTERRTRVEDEDQS